MKITVTKKEKPTPVTILHLEGALDGANSASLIDEAQKVFTAGVRDIIVDLIKLTFISSAGLGALHQVAQLFRGINDPEQEESWADYRWAAYRSNSRDHNRRSQEHVKLCSPTKEVQEILDIIGFSSLFEIYTDLNQAVASIQQTAPGMEASLR